MSYASAAAKLAYTHKWRIPEIPKIGEWLVKLYNFIDLDCLTRTLGKLDSSDQKKSRSKLNLYLKDKLYLVRYGKVLIKNNFVESI